MQTIKKDELFRNLGAFLKSKGIELTDGSYANRIRQGCNLLADAINATQKTVKHTKVQVDQALDRLRETIHQRTATKPRRQTNSKTKAKPKGKRPTVTAKKKSREVSPKV
jgi:hypothetical protein